MPRNVLSLPLLIQQFQFLPLGSTINESIKDLMGQVECVYLETPRDEKGGAGNGF